MNVRYDNPSDNRNGWGWDVRRRRIVEFVKAEKPDIMGMQEVLALQMADLREALKEYDCVGVGREDGLQRGEHTPVWWLKERYTLAGSGHLWLSETPNTAGSWGWDAACQRMATWVKLVDREEGDTILFMNTHFDHKGVIARKESARLILKVLQGLGMDHMPTILTGDLNVDEQSEAYGILASPPSPLYDTFALSTRHEGPRWTWHDFCRLPVDKRSKIDHIFANQWLTTIGTLITEPNQESPLSDHCFYLTNFQTL